MKRSIWLIIALVLAILKILSEIGVLPPLVGSICGPLVMLGIIAWMLPSVRRNGVFGYLILAALIVSMAADVAIGTSFIAGLALFLLAHILYIAAFAPKLSWRAGLLAIVPYGVAAAVVAPVILAGAEQQGMFIPVLVYISCITLMATVLLAAFIRQKGTFIYPAIGGVLFFASDSVLGYRTFVENFAYAGVVILITYWLAQLCIARVLTVHAKE